MLCHNECAHQENTGGMKRIVHVDLRVRYHIQCVNNTTSEHVFCEHNQNHNKEGNGAV